MAMASPRRTYHPATTHITKDEDKMLMRTAVHTQHVDRTTAPVPGQGQVHVKTLKKRVLVPEEKVVDVEVVRKEKVSAPRQHVVHGQKLIPVKKYKMVEETVLEVKEEMVNGRMEKRAHPVVRMKKIAYMDYEQQDVEIVVDVPYEEVVTRKGIRQDKHVVNRVMVVEEDHVYEMQPVYKGKGDTRMKEGEEHHKFKTFHGKPQWSEQTHNGWIGVPGTPSFKPELKTFERPTTAESIRPSTSGSTYPDRYGATTPRGGGRGNMPATPRGGGLGSSSLRDTNVMRMQ